MAAAYSPSTWTARRFLDRAEPGLVDELIEPARRRGRGSRRRIEIGFHLRGGEQYYETGAGARGLLIAPAIRTRDGSILRLPWRLKYRPTCVGAPLPAKQPSGLTERPNSAHAAAKLRRDMVNGGLRGLRSSPRSFRDTRLRVDPEISKFSDVQLHIVVSRFARPTIEPPRIEHLVRIHERPEKKLREH